MWAPNLESLLQLAILLRSSMAPHQEERKAAMDALESFKIQPEFLNYLCYILIEGETSEALESHFSAQELQNNRATAGLLLKNTMLDGDNFTKGIHDIGYVKANIIHGLYNSNSALVTNVTGIVITTLFSTYYRQHRDDPMGVQMISNLVELALNGSESSMKTLSKIMEDSAQFFQLEWSGKIKPIDSLISCFLDITANGSTTAVNRAESIKCLNTVIPLQPRSFSVRIDEFLNSLFQLAQNDDSDDVRVQVCIAFSGLLKFRPDKLVDNLVGLIHFMLHLISTVKEEKVSIEACEFIHSFCTDPNIPEHIIQPFVTDIVPVLLTKMVYNEESILVLESSNDDDASEEDKDEDIRPAAPRIVKKQRGDGESSDDDDDDGDSGIDESDVDTQWNLRKCAASTLDVMTNILPRDVMYVAFPFLKEHLNSERWFIREATVLALGAMAEGGMKYFDDQLPQLIPFLVEQLQDLWAPVRKITCWSLSRFAPWILKDHTEFLIPVLEPVIGKLMDRKKDVQEAAISSVAVFIESCDPELVETVLYDELLNSFNRCFEFYKKKNLIILYDAVSRFAEKVELDERAMKVLLPHLVNKWSSLPDNDKELWPLLECLSYVATSLGEKFMPMAPDVYERAFRILCHCVELEANSQQDPTIVVPEKDFIITSIDMIDGLVQGLGSQCQPLLFPPIGDNTLLQVMLQCLQDPFHEVRQSTFALLGDIVYFFEPQLLASTLSQFLKFIGTEIMHNDDFDGIPALINAIWCLGLISERINLGEYIIDLSRVLLDLFAAQGQPQDSAVLENLAITMGRISITLPEVFSNGIFASDAMWNRWCNALQDLDSLEEKSSAYMGFMNIVNLVGDHVAISNETLKNIIRGLSINVDPTPFAQSIYTFLMKHAERIQGLKFSQEEITFLQQFSGN
ncbi:hypothetical protein ZYGM_000082 [Zygosaccharomyces mellis]|uniref:Importin N-terminal domain-containing protein n=1 Tax=Zygosaccharomyces mellis TaxID=42258 RepID=A0A4C2E1F0_9SACH|nr:hypothetical protein ZYGM_000082 [Zygosaccharomyces mellis]